MFRGTKFSAIRTCSHSINQNPCDAESTRIAGSPTRATDEGITQANSPLPAVPRAIIQSNFVGNKMFFSSAILALKE